MNSMSKGKTYISTVSARTFSSGATRDVQSNKPEFVGYESTMVQREFGRYMLKHQTLLNGEHRTSDNWKKGMPRRVYLESLRRHYLDAVDAVTGDRPPPYPSLDREMALDALMAIIFNAQGLAREILLDRDLKEEEDE